MKPAKKRPLELLAPARNAEIALAAIDHGADAVYMGATTHGARHAAANSIDDIKRVTDYAHRFNARVYVTVNTLIYDNELEEVTSLVHELYRAGVDALIVQDMAMLSLPLPPIPLHASTQCDTRTPRRAKFLEEAGFSQIVLARELTLEEIAAIRAVTTVPLEGFVHGALCVSYSGNCQASYALTGRSANRGECAQICRLPFDLIDGNGNTVMTGKHLLSLRDMNRITSLLPMIEAGISSFKIEGRLKDINYVKTVVTAYRRALDEIIAARPDEFVRSSIGITQWEQAPSLESAFNRGYTDYFLHSRRPAKGVAMASVDTPKSIGESIGRVKRVKGKTIEINSRETINNGDGMSYYDSAGVLRGFRVNRADGNILHLTAPVSITPGTQLYRNLNTASRAELSRSRATRTIPVDMTLWLAPGNRLSLTVALSDKKTTAATATVELPEVTEARTPQLDGRHRTLAKLGDTIYTLNDLEDKAGGLFVPASLLATLRRDAIETLEKARKAAYPFEVRQYPATKPTTTEALHYNDNVANRLSRDYYQQAGATSIEPALENSPSVKPGTRVMLTRYCLRRELGHCLLTPEGKKLSGPLSLRGSNFSLNLDFDCRECEMSVFFAGKEK